MTALLFLHEVAKNRPLFFFSPNFCTCAIALIPLTAPRCVYRSCRCSVEPRGSQPFAFCVPILDLFCTCVPPTVDNYFLTITTYKSCAERFTYRNKYVIKPSVHYTRGITLKHKCYNTAAWHLGNAASNFQEVSLCESVL